MIMKAMYKNLLQIFNIKTLLATNSPHTLETLRRLLYPPIAHINHDHKTGVGWHETRIKYN